MYVPASNCEDSLSGDLIEGRRYQYFIMNLRQNGRDHGSAILLEVNGTIVIFIHHFKISAQFTLSRQDSRTPGIALSNFLILAVASSRQSKTTSC